MNTARPSAVFIGYQVSSVAPPFPLFNVEDPDNTTGRNHSTVGRATLEKIGIDIPPFPPYTEWQAKRGGQ